MFYSIYGFPLLRVCPNSYIIYSSSKIGARFFKFSFLLFNIFLVIASFYALLTLNKFYIALFDSSLLTFIKLSESKSDYLPNIFYII